MQSYLCVDHLVQRPGKYKFLLNTCTFFLSVHGVEAKDAQKTDSEFKVLGFFAIWHLINV